MVIVIDMDPDNVQDFERTCDRTGIDIREVEARGPAGGCPRYTLVVDSKEGLEALGGFYFEGIVPEAPATTLK